MSLVRLPHGKEVYTEEILEVRPTMQARGAAVQVIVEEYQRKTSFDGMSASTERVPVPTELRQDEALSVMESAWQERKKAHGYCTGVNGSGCYRFRRGEEVPKDCVSCQIAQAFQRSTGRDPRPGGNMTPLLRPAQIGPLWQGLGLFWTGCCLYFLCHAAPSLYLQSPLCSVVLFVSPVVCVVGVCWHRRKG